MTLVLDAGPIVAMADRRSRLGNKCQRILEEEPGSIVLSAAAAAEADYLLSTRLGRAAGRLFLEDLASGVYQVEWLTPDEHGLLLDVDRRCPGLGLSDLSIVVLAARFRTHRLMTFDERDFRRVLALDGAPFVILPADEPRFG